MSEKETRGSSKVRLLQGWLQTVATTAMTHAYDGDENSSHSYSDFFRVDEGVYIEGMGSMEKGLEGCDCLQLCIRMIDWEEMAAIRTLYFLPLPNFACTFIPIFSSLFFPAFLFILY